MLCWFWHIPTISYAVRDSVPRQYISSWPKMRNFRCVATPSRTIIMSHHLLLNCGKALFLSSDPPFMSARKEIVNRKPQFLESFWNCYSAFKYPPIKFHRKSFNCESVFESSFVVWGFEFFKCWSLGVGWILQNSLSKLLIQLQFVQKHSTPLRLWKCHRL